jgi:hypothetical protein
LARELDPLEDVREQLLKSLPALAHHYHIRPWEVELLTFNEINEFLEQYDDYVKKLTDG